MIALLGIVTLSSFKPFYMWKFTPRAGTNPVVSWVSPTPMTFPLPPAGFPTKLYAFIAKECRRSGVPFPLVCKLIQVESNWKNSATPNYGKKHKLLSIDYGLFQLNSKNIKEFIIKYKDPNRSVKSYDLIHSNYDNATIGIRHLARLYSVFKDWEKVCAAYNAGARKVKQNNIPHSTQHYVQAIAPYPWWAYYKENMIAID